MATHIEEEGPGAAACGEGPGECPPRDLPVGCQVRVYATRRVRVRYTTDARFPDHALDPAAPIRDEELAFPDGPLVGWLRARLEDLPAGNDHVPPRAVQEIALLADHALRRFRGPPFCADRPGLRARADESAEHPLEVRIVARSDVAVTTRPEWQHVEVGRGLARELHMRLVPHVVFHRLQYLALGSATNGALREQVLEGGASFAAEALGAPASPGGSLWRALGERLSAVSGASAAPLGFDFYLAVLEESALRGPDLAAARRAWRRRTPHGSFDEALAEWHVAESLQALGLSAPDPRLRTGGARGPRPRPRIDRVELTSRGRYRRDLAALPPLGRLALVAGTEGQGTRMLAVRLELTEGSGALFVLRVRPGGRAALDLWRSAGSRDACWLRLEPGERALAVVAAGPSGCGGSLLLEDHERAAALSVTPANAAAGSAYPLDPAMWSWTWISPDVMVDNDDDGRADPVRPGRLNRLKVRVFNRGNARAHGICLRASWQPGATRPVEDGWRPVLDASGVPAEARTRGSLEPDELRWFTLEWAAPREDFVTWFLRVEVAAAAEENTLVSLPRAVVTLYAKTAASPDTRLDLRLGPSGAADRLIVVPRGPRVTLVPERSAEARFRVERGARRSPAEHPFRRPDAAHYHAVDPRTLPPGLDPAHLVTVVHLGDEGALGGLTFALSCDASPLRPCPGRTTTLLS